MHRHTCMQYDKVKCTLCSTSTPYTYPTTHPPTPTHTNHKLKFHLRTVSWYDWTASDVNKCASASRNMYASSPANIDSSNMHFIPFFLHPFLIIINIILSSLSLSHASVSLSLTHTHSQHTYMHAHAHAHTHTCMHTHTLSYTHTLSLPVSISLSYTHTLSLSFSLSFSLSLSLTHSQWLTQTHMNLSAINSARCHSVQM